MSDDRPPATDLGRRLLEVGPRLAHAQRHLLNHVDPPLSYRQYRVLAAIAAGSNTLTALYTPASVGLSTLSEIVDSLARRDLVGRRPSARDRRAVELTPTAAGRRVLADAEARLDALAGRIIEDLPPSAVSDVAEAVDRVNESVQDLLAEHHARRQAGPRDGS